jgi:transposase-like protein
MDALERFRRQVTRELGDRQGAQRRYSTDLRHAAVAYWRTREAAGAGLHAVATALGVAPVSLRRWAQDAPVRPVQVMPDAGPERRLVVTISAAGVRVDGLDVSAVAELVARLR